MPGKTAGIIIVGDEILKGHVKDINSHFMCKRLRAIGTKVGKISVVEDNVEDIGKTVKEFSQKFDLVLTTGGIGPTHDDVTYRGVAAGFDQGVVCNDVLEAYWNNQSFSNNIESAQAMSLIPESGEIIWTTTETVLHSDKDGAKVNIFPMIRINNVFIFPGIPKYLQALFIALEKKYFQSHGCSFFTGKIYLSVNESLILKALNRTVEDLKDCVFGSYPVFGNAKYKTLITVEAISVDRVRAAEDFFKALISPQWLADWNTEMPNSVYKILQVTADPSLADALNKSIKLVEQSFLQYPERSLMVSFNGGKDCTVLLNIILAVKENKGLVEPLQAVYFQPANPFPEVDQFIKETVARHQIELTTLPGPIKPALEVLIQQKPDVQAIFLGTRHTDPFSKDLGAFQMTDPGWTQVMRINPILDWSYQHIWTFLRGISAPYCPLYDQGYTSLGNQDNTRPNPCLLYTSSDGTQRYQPAWMLTDDSVERDGRF